MNGFSFSPEGGQAYAEMRTAALTLPADLRGLASGDSDAELLAAADRDTALPARLFRAAQPAYHHARAHPLADWQALDASWRQLAPSLAHLVFEYGDAPPYTAAENAVRVRVVRAALTALEHFTAVAVPVMSPADRLAAQPVPTVVRAARLACQIHPLEPMLPPSTAASELPTVPPAGHAESTPAAPQPAKRRSAA